MQVEQADPVACALSRAEEEARRIVESVLAGRLGSYDIIISVDYDDKGVRRLVVDVRTSSGILEKRLLEAAAEEAARRAAREFERAVRECERSIRASGEGSGTSAQER